MRSIWHRLWHDPPPTLACEFSAGAMALARWSAGASRPEAMAVRLLSEGALRPSPVRENLAEPDEAAAAVASALLELSYGNHKGRHEIVLLLPDLSARVSVLEFDHLPNRSDEIFSLLKFRLKKTVPFDVEEAALCYQLQGAEALVAVTPRAVVRQYEALFEEQGFAPGLITLSTLAGLGLVETASAPGSGAGPGPGPAGQAPRAGAGLDVAGTMLLRESGKAVTIAILSQGKLRMFRTTELASENSAEPHAVEEMFHDVYSSAVFFEDHYGGRVQQVLLAGLEKQAEPLAAMVEAELRVRPRQLELPARSPEQARFLGLFGVVADQARA